MPEPGPELGKWAMYPALAASMDMMSEVKRTLMEVAKKRKGVSDQVRE